MYVTKFNIALKPTQKACQVFHNCMWPTILMGAEINRIWDIQGVLFDQTFLHIAFFPSGILHIVS